MGSGTAVERVFDEDAVDVPLGTKVPDFLALENSALFNLLSLSASSPATCLHTFSLVGGGAPDPIAESGLEFEEGIKQVPR